MANKKEIIEEADAPIETPEEITETPEVTEETKPEVEAPKAEAAPAAKCECDGEAVVARNRLGTHKVCIECGKKK